MRFWLSKDGIRSIWDDQSLFGTKAGIIQPESLITGKMSRSFFYHQQPFGELNWQRQSIFQPEECQFVCGVHAFDGNPSNNINSKKKIPGRGLPDSWQYLQLGLVLLRQYVSSTLTNYPWWHEVRLDSWPFFGFTRGAGISPTDFRVSNSYTQDSLFAEKVSFNTASEASYVFFSEWTKVH